MIKLEITEQQFKALSKKKLADVVSLISTVNSLKERYEDLTIFLDKFLSNESIDVIYHGGSNPGVQRKIIPKSIKENGDFSAFCVNSEVFKNFKLEKIELI
ncbi:MAG: hypothetical protein QM504_01965 [Pseudomonadota bacterium]